MQREGDLLTRRLQRGNDDLNEEVTAAQSELVDAIGRKMLEVVDRYARENGYTVVLDTLSGVRAGYSPVAYGSSQSDMTQEIVRLYDQALSGQGCSRFGGIDRRAGSEAPDTPAAPAPAKKADFLG